MKKNTENQNDRTVHAVNPDKVKQDDLMAFVYYAKVKNAFSQVLELENVDSTSEFRVEGRALIEKGLSADQFHETTKVTKTKAAEMLVSSYNRPLTVCFEKTNGEERVLRGRLVTPEPLLGRSMMEDLDIRGKNRLRLVDHRTIKYLVVEGVKYVVK